MFSALILSNATVTVCYNCNFFPYCISLCIFSFIRYTYPKYCILFLFYHTSNSNSNKNLFASQSIDRIQISCFYRWQQSKTTPISMENSTEPMIAGMLIAVGAPESWDTTLDNIIPTTTPMIPPILVSMAASVRN